MMMLCTNTGCGEHQVDQYEQRDECMASAERSMRKNPDGATFYCVKYGEIKA